MNPKISIITPIYDNGKEYLGLKWLSILNQCIENQIEQNFEWVIVYDGINEECRKQVETYKNVKYFELDKRYGNWGNYSRDFGLQQSSGEYVVFIDQDNIIFENYLSVLSDVLDCDKKIGFSLCPIYISYQCKPNIMYPYIERSRVNTLCFMARRKLFSISGWWSRMCGNGDEYFILKNLIDSGVNAVCMGNYGALAIWNGIRYKYIKEIYPSFINYSDIENLAGDSDNDTRKDKDLWFTHQF